jgi:fibronectin type 3 domain-containing protein
MMNTIHTRVLLRIVLTGVVALGAALAGCSNEHEDGFTRVANDPEVSGVDAPRASGLYAHVGNRSVTLFWDDVAAASYRVFRRTGEDREVELEDAITDTTYVDRGLTNGLLYRYRVAAVHANGLQGDPSDPVFVVPSAYGVLAEGGAPFVTETDVSLTLSAPDGTTSMRFGEQADLSDVSWRPFAVSGTVRIAPGDGLRTIHAQFLDPNGNESAVVSDQITLDTRAEILSVSQDAGATPVAPGETVRFTVVTGEVDGEASIDVDGARSGIALFDDGAHGDGGANDGTYAVDWIVPADVEVRNAVVFGNFRDAAGNEAEPGTATEPLTINAPPLAVTLNPASNVEATSVDLSWSQSQDADFAAYRLLRAPSADVTTDPDRVVVTVIDDPDETAFTDTGVDENQEVFFVVEVVDDFGARTASNVIAVTTPNDPPTAVVLTEEGTTPVSVSMSWTESTALDFALYRVLRAVDSSPGVFNEVAQFDQQARTTYTDFFTVPADTTYYFYKIVVEDLAGETSESNVISASVGP